MVQHDGPAWLRGSCQGQELLRELWPLQISEVLARASRNFYSRGGEEPAEGMGHGVKDTCCMHGSRNTPCVVNSVIEMA